MSLDLRTRSDADVAPVETAAFFSAQLPECLARNHELIAPRASCLSLRPLTLEVDERCWTLTWDGRAHVRNGAVADAAHVQLTAKELSELANDLITPVSLFASGDLRMVEGGPGDVLDWWLVLRGALDDRRLHTPGAISFADRDGARLDLGRSFRPDDSPEEMSHFLHEAGYLHIQGLFRQEEMDQISADMDRAASTYSDGDGKSWWATTRDGERRLVRMQCFDHHSPTTTALLADDRLLRLGRLPGDDHVHAHLESNRIEALVKPIGVVSGISDLPWHKDCSLGRHSYECCSVTVGISVTGADATSGQLRVVAGSHRALLRPAILMPGCHDLPEVDLPTRTGDVTLHLSCTLHMSKAPRERERRVMYTAFRLPVVLSEAARQARARIRDVREKAPLTVSQPPSRG